MRNVGCLATFKKIKFITLLKQRAHKIYLYLKNILLDFLYIHNDRLNLCDPNVYVNKGHNDCKYMYF